MISSVERSVLNLQHSICFLSDFLVILATYGKPNTPPLKGHFPDFLR